VRHLHGDHIIPEDLCLPLALSAILKTPIVTLLFGTVLICLSLLCCALQNGFVHNYLLQEAFRDFSQNEIDDILHFKNWLTL
jgi:hypothetical protein